MMTENSSGLFDDAPPESAPVFPQPADAALKEMMQRLPSSIYLGTSSWNFPGWRGIVWSRGSGLNHLAADGLAAYSASPLFRTVGLDRNSYRPLSASAFAAFARQVPEDFRFLVKAPRDVTDPYLRNDRGGPRAHGTRQEMRAACLSVFATSPFGIEDHRVKGRAH